MWWTICWFPDSVRFFAVSSPSWQAYGSPQGHVITWEGSVLNGTLHKVRDDLNTQAVSPDGSLIAAFRPGPKDLWAMRELWVMDTEGGNARKLLDAGDQSGFEAAQWSPDGTKLLYLKNHEDGRSMEFLDVTTLDHHVVIPKLEGVELFWLRDGRVLFTGLAEKDENCDYWAGRLNERTGAFVSQPKELIQNRGFCVRDTSATADGKKLVFTRRTDVGAVYVADLESGGTRITPPKPVTMGASEEMPSGWTADSREVVFTSFRDGKFGVYRQPLNGGAVQSVYLPGPTNNRLDGASTSRDGRWLLITRTPQGDTHSEHKEVFRIPIGGGTEELIASNIEGFDCAATAKLLCAYSEKENNQLVFKSFGPESKQGRVLGRFTLLDPKDEQDGWALSPDATQIAIVAGRTGHIYLLNLETQSLRHFLVKGLKHDASVVWTADGKGLFLSILDPDGVLLHTDLHGNANVLWETHDSRVLWCMPSPDGKHIAMPRFSSDVNVWMLEDF
jgi:Tol biopolymer transport system component